jgi:hypothetical protein
MCSLRNAHIKDLWRIEDRVCRCHRIPPMHQIMRSYARLCGCARMLSKQACEKKSPLSIHFTVLIHSSLLIPLPPTTDSVTSVRERRICWRYQKSLDWWPRTSRETTLHAAFKFRRGGETCSSLTDGEPLQQATGPSITRAYPCPDLTQETSSAIAT